MSDVWRKMPRWDLVIPPSRPSTAQLDYIRGHIADLNRDSSVAVLGSTPEFRDLLAQLGFFRVTVFDKNPEFFAQMSAARIGPSKESFVEGNWLDVLAPYKDEFSIILSDLTSGNIEYAGHERFYALIEAALKPAGGMFFDKVLSNEKPLLSLDEIEDGYSWQPTNLQSVNYFSCEALFCSELIAGEGVVDTSRFYDTLAGRFKSERLQKFIQLAELITPRDCIWYYGLPWNKVSPAYCPRLKLVEAISMPDDGPYTGRVRHFLLTKV